MLRVSSGRGSQGGDEMNPFYGGFIIGFILGAVVGMIGICIFIMSRIGG